MGLTDDIPDREVEYTEKRIKGIHDKLRNARPHERDYLERCLRGWERHLGIAREQEVTRANNRPS